MHTAAVVLGCFEVDWTRERLGTESHYAIAAGLRLGARKGVERVAFIPMILSSQIFVSSHTNG